MARLLAAALLAGMAACTGPGWQPVSPSEYSGGPMESPMMGGGG